MWAALVAFIVGGLRALFGGAKPASPTGPTVNQVIAGAQMNAVAYQQEIDKVASVGDASERDSLQHPDTLRAPDPNSRD